MLDIRYEQAIKALQDYMGTHTVQFDMPRAEVEALRTEFLAKFSPENLSALDDSNLLAYMFLTADGSNDSLCYHLEFNPKLKRTYGSISGGSSFKFGLFQRQEDGKWITGAPTKQEVLSDAEALELGKTIRDYLVNGCKIISESTLESESDYDVLDNTLNEMLGKFASYAWVQKYFHLVFEEKFVGWYVTDWLKHLLYGFGIEPSSTYYGMNGQLALIKRGTTYSSHEFANIGYAMFGDIRHFYRLGSSDSSEHYSLAWKDKGIVAVGWSKTGDLLNYIKNGAIEREKLSDALLREYYPNDSKTASRKAGEIKSFFETSADAVFVVMDGTQFKGFVDGLTPYYYDDTSDMAHCKGGVWKTPFNDDDRLPEDEGRMTTCYEIRKPANLLYLYKKYYNFANSTVPQAEVISSKVDHTVRFRTYYADVRPRNWVFFGAPGTGKSFTLNKEKNALLSKGGEYERVTFHPDYSYANFVGTYKPVPKGEAITYAYVPGPFMRTYVKAIKNSRTTDIKPFLLIIEEINRANVAAVFGEVFQLLDRGDDNVSEYPIQATEDMKKYLASALGGDPEDYAEIRIPDNMFIWATMNSADQGVFPMDTAFKRRWDFTYLGIDDSEDGIAGKKVVLGKGEYRRIVEWNALRKAINEELLEYKVNEDKLMGPYFIAKKNLPEGDIIEPEEFIRIFKNKVIMYLFDDAAKQKRLTLFSGCEDKAKNQYSKICHEFETKGVYIFCENIRNKFIEIPEDNEE